MREKSLPESVLCTRPIIFIALKCSLLIYFFKELCLCKYWEADIHSFGERKWSDSEAYVAQRAQGWGVLMVSWVPIFFVIICCILVFSFRNLLEVGGNSLAAPNLLNTSSRRNSGVFPSSRMEQRKLVWAEGIWTWHHKRLF